MDFAQSRQRKYSLGMRSVSVTAFRTLFFVLLLARPLPAQRAVEPDPLLAEAQKLFLRADFRGAAAAYRKIIQEHPSEQAYSGLVQSLLKADDFKSAEESAQKALDALPKSAVAHAERGDVYFRRGLIPEAAEEYSAALKLDHECARAWLGQGKVDAAYSRHAKAKEAVGKAHDLDPKDGDAFYEWAIRLAYPENVTALERHLAEFHNDAETERHERQFKELLKALAGRRVWIPAKAIERTEIKMETLTMGPSLVRRGYGLRVRLNDRATVTLMLDTGSSGVTITRKLAEKIGAAKLSEQALEGVGKSGPATGYKAWLDKIVIGDLEFHDCFVQATPREIAEVDGIIGTDVFAKYLITIDLPMHKLRLDPLPAKGQGAMAEQANDFAQTYSFGHFLLLSTEVGKKATGLFVIDSGSNGNTISPELAKLVPGMRAYNMPMSGASGTENSALIADRQTLRFAKVSRSDEQINTVELHGVSKDLGVEISGQLGFAAMENMKLTINYRDGLVRFAAK